MPISSTSFTRGVAVCMKEVFLSYPQSVTSTSTPMEENSKPDAKRISTTMMEVIRSILKNPVLFRMILIFSSRLLRFCVGDCNHGRSVIYFAESISNPIGFRSFRCKSWHDFIKSGCKKNDISYMGESARAT